MKSTKITTSNYFATIKKIGFENLPLVLKQSHTVIMTKTINGEDWSKYKNDADLKRMIDLVFKKLEEFIRSNAKPIHGNHHTSNRKFEVEQKFITDFLKLHDTSKTKTELLQFVDGLKNAINQRKIRKTSLVANEIMFIQSRIIAKINQSRTEKIHIKLREATITKMQDALQLIEEQNIGISSDKEDDLSKETLDGISENTAIEPEKPSIMNSKDFANMKFNTIGFKDKWLDFIGDPAQGFTAMVFGMPKMGKSYLCMEFAGYLARHHGKVLYVAKEEKLEKTLQDKINDLQVAHENLILANALPTDLTAYNFIFIDSVNKQGLTTKDLERLKLNNKGKSFIYVFQATKSGQFKGNNEFQHDVDVVIEIPELGKATQYGRFNQGGELDIFPESNKDLTSKENVSMLDGINNKDMKNKKNDWTTPEFLKQKDHDDLKEINRLYKEGKMEQAYNYASNLDTIVREEIPASIWKAIGGQLTKKGESNLKLEKTIDEIDENIQKLTEVITIISKNKNANWGHVGSLANLHQQLGEHLFDDYHEHEGYSANLTEGLKRHASASKKLLNQIHKKVSELVDNAALPDLNYWNTFLKETAGSFRNILLAKEEAKPSRKLLTRSASKLTTIETELGIALEELAIELIPKNKPKEGIIDLIDNHTTKVEKEVESMAEEAIKEEGLDIKIKSVKFKENDSNKLSTGASYYKIELEGTLKDLKKMAGEDKLFYYEW